MTTYCTTQTHSAIEPRVFKAKAPAPAQFQAPASTRYLVQAQPPAPASTQFQDLTRYYRAPIEYLASTQFQAPAQPPAHPSYSHNYRAPAQPPALAQFQDPTRYYRAPAQPPALAQFQDPTRYYRAPTRYLVQAQPPAHHSYSTNCRALAQFQAPASTQFQDPTRYYPAPTRYYRVHHSYSPNLTSNFSSIYSYGSSAITKPRDQSSLIENLNSSSITRLNSSYAIETLPPTPNFGSIDTLPPIPNFGFIDRLPPTLNLSSSHGSSAITKTRDQLSSTENLNSNSSGLDCLNSSSSSIETLPPIPNFGSIDRLPPAPNFGSIETLPPTPDLSSSHGSNATIEPRDQSSLIENLNSSSSGLDCLNFTYRFISELIAYATETERSASSQISSPQTTIEPIKSTRFSVPVPLFLNCTRY